MKVILLFDLADPPPPEADYSGDLGDENWRSEADVARALRRLGHDVRLIGLCDDIEPLLELARREKPDLVFNLCEAFRRDRGHEPDVAALLELLGVPYTGADPKALRLCKDKALAKQVVAASGVRTPNSVVWRRGESEPELGGLAFPVLVKPVGLESSQGISRSSLAPTRAAALERAHFLHQRLAQDALIEEYVEGRELHVAALAGVLFPARETVFRASAGARFLTFRAKWDDAYRRRQGIRTGPARKFKPIEENGLSRACERACRALGLTGYARIDMRMTPEGEAVFLEANPNPAIGSRDDFALAAARAGVPYDRLIERIVELA